MAKGLLPNFQVIGVIAWATIGLFAKFFMKQSPLWWLMLTTAKRFTNSPPPHAAGVYILPPPSLNFWLISAMPLRATSRNSWVICIEQNLGPHIEQKCATLCASLGKVASW